MIEKDPRLKRQRYDPDLGIPKDLWPILLPEPARKTCRSNHSSKAKTSPKSSSVRTPTASKPAPVSISDPIARALKAEGWIPGNLQHIKDRNFIPKSGVARDREKRELKKKTSHLIDLTGKKRIGIAEYQKNVETIFRSGKMERLGLDMGTKNIVLAYKKDGQVCFRREVNGFISVVKQDNFTKEMLVQSQVPFIERDKDFIAIGGKAEDLAYSFGKELQRPMVNGVLSVTERQAMSIMGVIVKSIIGKLNDDAILCYCIPGNAINQEVNVDFHNKVIQAILASFDVKVKLKGSSINEARAIVIARSPDKDKSGIGISCLTGNNVVYTSDGLKKIRDVQVGDKVLSKSGVFNKVYAVTPSNKPVNDLLKIEFPGSSWGLTLTKDHQVWADKGDGWNWYRADELDSGDIVGEPVPIVNQKRNFISLKVKEGNADSHCEVFECSKAVGRFIGYFLADGHIDTRSRDGEDARVVFDFGPGEEEYANDVSAIADSVFHRKVNDRSGDRNNLRIEFYFASLARWLRKRCYGENKSKQFPFDITATSRPFREGLVAGLIRGDGCVKDDSVSFENTSQNLVQTLHLALSTLGIKSSLCWREPREGGAIDGRKIVGSGSFCLVVSGADVEKVKALVTDDKSKSEAVWMQGGFWCTRIKSIADLQGDRNEEVWDLSVENDPSFCVPFATVHNCGAGMINVCYCLFGVPVYEFSIVGAGDWIDKESGKATNESPTAIAKVKESPETRLDGGMPADFVRRAIFLNYTILIERIAKSIAEGFRKNEGKARAPKPMPIYIAGGTASVGGFLALFKEVFAKQDMPFQIGEISLVDKPLYAVAEGCLIAAEKHEA